MKKAPANKKSAIPIDEMRSEYRFNHGSAKPNRFAAGLKSQPHIVALDPDVSKVFTTFESVNNALRAIISAVPVAPSK